MERFSKSATRARSTGLFRIMAGIALVSCGLFASATIPAAGAAPAHYVFFNLDRERIREPWFADTDTFQGAQLKYTWKELEPDEGEYNLKPIRDDLDFLKSKGKKLFVQLQEASFDTNRVLIPNYLRKKPEYHGGADLQFAFEDDAETKAKPEGWVARRWDPAVRARFHRLLQELGRQLDGQIVGLNLPETAVSFGEKTNRHPAGFTFAGYRDAIQANMKAAKAAFPKSVVLQYANFMPGEWLPGNDQGYLKGIYGFASANGIGVGGPDLLPFRKGQLNHSYPLIKSASGKVPTGIAVQFGNYEAINPMTSRRVSIAELFEFARAELRVDYLFWSTQEPYFTKSVIPFLENLRKQR